MRSCSTSNRLASAFLALTLAGGSVLSTSTAFAGPEEAGQFYKQAQQAYQNGDFSEAADYLERAYAEDPKLIYQYNRIRALQGAGDFQEALRLLKLYANRMTEDERFASDIPRLRDELEQAVAEQESQSAQTAEATTSESPEAPMKSRAASDSGATSASGSAATPIGWTLIGVGVASLGTAGLFGSGMLGSGAALDRLNDSSFDYAASDQHAPGADRTLVNTHQTITWVTLGVGAASAITGGLLLYLNRTDTASAQENDAPSASATNDVTVSPYVSGDGAGAAFSLEF